MVAKASSVSHGYNALNYVCTKKDAMPIKFHNLPEGLDMGKDAEPSIIWESMQTRHRRQKVHNSGRLMTRNIIRIELAPSPEETTQLKTPDDWKKLLDDWMNEMEKVCNCRDKKGKPKSIDFNNSQYIAVCHFDSGKPHIHVIVNRIREEGETNYTQNIGRNATLAANVVNEKRGWVQSQKIHDDHLDKIYEDAIQSLKEMPEFDWNIYKRKMEEKGYKMPLRRDSKGKVVSYRVNLGNSSFKASEIGTGKQLTAAHIFKTWLKLHPEKQYNHQLTTVGTPNARDEEKKVAANSRPTFNSINEHQKFLSSEKNRYVCNIDMEKCIRTISIPWNIFNEIKQTAYCQDEDGEDFADLQRQIYPIAAALWCAASISGNAVMEYINLATQIHEGGGGGGGVHGELSSWGRDKDEDDKSLARRAATFASELFETKSIRHNRGRRR